ncbi:MAG: NAD(P)/FAD-dependent oxidoreductase, partial [Hyalangium sp.]|uniref:NAD(P)/FAD-dependent oxidoreductase n=1 Tax=Hyalangium sp. TaxID=2028555 RepID=UPI00389A89BB
MSVPDLIVAGGGIVGLTSALAAARRGLRVTVVDQPRPGAASRNAAGLLAPSIGVASPAVRDAGAAAREFYPGFLDALLERTEIPVPLDREGIIELALSEQEFETLSRNSPQTAERLDANRLATLEPSLGIHPGALLHSLDGAVDNVALMNAIDVAVVRHSRITRITDEVASFDPRGNLPGFRSRGGTRYAGQRLLVANGAWAGSLPGIPRPLPVRPVRGQLLRLEGQPLRHVTHVPGGYLVPRAGATVVGATNEDVGFDTGITQRGLKDLRTLATRAVTALGSAPMIDHWSGLRPMAADGLPILGADPDVPSLCYACGFSRNG